MERPLLVGIAGGTASGKTTLARLLVARRADLLLVSHDRYYRDVPDPHGHNYDHPNALESALLAVHLGELAAGRAVELPEYDFSLHRRRGRGEKVQPAPIVLVEGILVLAIPEVRALLDLKIFVDASDDVRFERRLLRDVAQRGRSASSVRAQYEATVRPMHERFVAPSAQWADLRLDGTGQIEDEFAKLSAALGSQLRDFGHPDAS